MPEQPVDVPVTVYVAVVNPLNVTVVPVEALKPVDGAQVYVVAPLAVISVVFPVQMVDATGVTVSTGTVVTVNVFAVVDVQPYSLVTVSDGE